MNVAISHDWLLNRRGSERVLKEFCLCLDDLAIYTLFLDPEAVDPAIKQHSIFVSRLDRLPGIPRYYRYLFPWFGQAIEHHNVTDETVLLSISHAVAKGIPHRGDIPHICYCQSPMRYLWEPKLYGSVLTRSWRGTLFSLFVDALRRWDLESNRSVDHFVSTSRTVQERVRRLYGRDSQIIYPCIDSDFFKPSYVLREDFYVVVSALVPHKRLELAVQAFNRNRKRLLVVGSGPLERRLSRMAKPNVEFLGWLSDHQVRELYCRARALILPGPEEFGLVAIEAQACGCPVIAYGEAGVTETVVEGRTGVFFRDARSEALMNAVQSFESSTFDECEMLDNAGRFSRPRFRSEWEAFFRGVGLSIQMC